MTIRAVLFDVGRPLSTEVEYERAIDADIRSLFAEAGKPVTDARYAEAWRSAVDSLAPNAYEAVIWQLSEGDEEIAPSVYREVSRRSHERGSFQLREGIPALLAELAARGLRLGLAANQPAEVIGRLEERGIAKFFQSTAVSGTHGYRKPDVRLSSTPARPSPLSPENASWSATASIATSSPRSSSACARCAGVAAATPARSRAPGTSARTPKPPTCPASARRSLPCLTEPPQALFGGRALA